MVFRPTRGRIVYCCLGPIYSLFWYVLQTNGHRGEPKMSSEGLLVVAGVVFALMITGLFVSMNEFLKASKDPSTVKSTDGASSDLES